MTTKNKRKTQYEKGFEDGQRDEAVRVLELLEELRSDMEYEDDRAEERLDRGIRDWKSFLGEE